jgi:uncharacterized repeat protein (TIGR02543 family)
MNTKKVPGCGLIAVILLLAFTACEQSTDPPIVPVIPPVTTITYTAVQTGGTSNTNTSTGIVFTFSASVDSLNVADITVGGAAAKGSATLSGSGTSWTLSTITVNNAGLANVSINKEGIETATKSVIVHKQGQVTPTEYRTIAWNFNGGTPGVGAQYPSQIVKDAVLAEPSPDPTKAGNAFVGWYSDLGLTTAYNFASTVTANLNLYAKWEPVITYTVEQIGGVDFTADTTGIKFVFSASIDGLGLTAANIYFYGMMQGGAETFTGSGTTWTLSPIPVMITTAGPMSVQITKTGIEAEVKYVTLYKEGQYVPVTVGQLRYARINNNTEYSVSAANQEISGAIVIPASYNSLPVTAIGNSAFNGCAGITSISIPASVTSIDNTMMNPFSGCTNLTAITVDPNNPTYASEGGILYNKAKTTLMQAPAKISTVTIPATVTTIDMGAFAGCTSLTSITIPASVTSIGNSAFNGCPSLTAITVDASNSNYASEGGILYNKAKTTLIQAPGGISGTVSIPASVTSIGMSAFYYCTGLTSITIPANVTSIGSSAFTGCAITNITIPTNVTSIGMSAFYGCTGLTSITIPGSVTTIDMMTFSGCTSLASITISEGVTTINMAAFTGCAITNITIPASVTTIGPQVFQGCTSLTAITVSEGNSNFVSEGGILYNEDKTTLIQAPAKISGTVTIPATVTSIGQGAFYYCTGLTSITIPEDVTTVGSGAFFGWTSSQTIYVKGYATEAAANTAWNTVVGTSWLLWCDAVRKYWNGTAGEYQ